MSAFQAALRVGEAILPSAATGRSVEIPERLRAFMQGEKRSVPMARTFEAFKDYLLSQA